MSKRSKILFLCAGLFLVVAVVMQVITGLWMNINSLLAAGAVALAVAAMVFDYRLYWEFFTLRTTKHGMNMGTMIVLVVSLLVCVNYLANRHNKVLDLTHEKLHSLSDQSEKIVKGLDKDLSIKIFYKGPAGAEEKTKTKATAELYQDASPKVRVQSINAYADEVEALKYLKDIPDIESVLSIVFVEYGDKKLRVDYPYEEAQITSAIIKATRTTEAKVYFVKGHGEKDVEGGEDQGLKEFVNALNEASFKSEALNLIDKKGVPEDATVVAIIGPTTPYLEDELRMLREYARKGGKLFIALDPGQRHNLANLTKTLGVQFENDYVLTRRSIQGGGMATVLGRKFDPTVEATKTFVDGMSAVFPLVSEVRAAPDKSPDIQVKEMVKSDEMSFATADPTKPLKETPQMKSVPIGVEARGKLDGGSDEKAGSFAAVVFGDSDFLSNRGLFFGINRDLALNAIADLSNQKDLISIKPKMPEGTMLVLTRFAQLALIICGLALPLALLITGGVLWFKRRGA